MCSYCELCIILCYIPRGIARCVFTYYCCFMLLLMRDTIDRQSKSLYVFVHILIHDSDSDSHYKLHHDVHFWIHTTSQTFLHGTDFYHVFIHFNKLQVLILVKHRKAV